jgi:sulfatase maturation enzyme AslB (radical SAM superfamily)
MAKINEVESIDALFSGYKENVNDIINKFIGNTATDCDNCPIRITGVYPLAPELDTIDISTIEEFDSCNAKCCYCHSGNCPKPSREARIRRSRFILDLLRYVNETVAINDRKVQINFAAGELSIADYCDEALSIVENSKNINATIFTNAMVFKESIMASLQSGKGDLLVSVDSGTSETYRKTHGLDVYEKVLANLRKYAESNCEIRLKYIILDDMNDNEKDVEGFLDFAKEIGAKAVLSHDVRYRESKLKTAAALASLAFIRKCIAEGITYRLRDTLAFFSDDIYGYGTGEAHWATVFEKDLTFC